MPEILTVIKNINLNTELVLLPCFPLFSASSFFPHSPFWWLFFLLFILLSFTHFSVCYFFSTHQFWPTYSSSDFARKTKSLSIYNNGWSPLSQSKLWGWNAFRCWWFMSSQLEANTVISNNSHDSLGCESLQSGKHCITWKLINHSTI